MALRTIALALSAIALTAPLSAAAPAGTSDTKYCMHIDALTGSRIEQIKCWTRDEWAEQGVDVDRDWAKEGVRTLD